MVTGIIGPCPGYASTSMFDQGFSLPASGKMVSLSPAFSPVVLKGIKLDQKDPLKFHFFIDPGDALKMSPMELKNESTKLIKYFLASLTIPDKDLWVNLSPYEKDRIVPLEFGKTEMGRDLLAEDYILKQITASLIYPESKLGKEFWDRVYAQTKAKYGTTNIPVNTFNKVWIIPDKAVVYENGGTAFVIENHLKVMLEEDYLSLTKHLTPTPQATNALASQIVREIVIPALTKEVNEGKNFAQLRQVFNSFILANWYKNKIKDSIINKVFSNRKRIANLFFSNDPIGNPEHIYRQYIQAFRKGVYNYIKEEPDPSSSQMVPRKYFSGGIVVTNSATTTVNGSGINSRNLPNNVFEATVKLNFIDDAMLTQKMTILAVSAISLALGTALWVHHSAQQPKMTEKSIETNLFMTQNFEIPTKVLSIEITNVINDLMKLCPNQQWNVNEYPEILKLGGIFVGFARNPMTSLHDLQEMQKAVDEFPLFQREFIGADLKHIQSNFTDPTLVQYLKDTGKIGDVTFADNMYTFSQIHKDVWNYHPNLPFANETTFTMPTPSFNNYYQLAFRYKLNIPEDLVDSLVNPNGKITWPGANQKLIDVIHIQAILTYPLTRDQFQRVFDSNNPKFTLAALYNPFIPLDLAVQYLAINYKYYDEGFPISSKLEDLYPDIDPRLLQETLFNPADKRKTGEPIVFRPASTNGDQVIMNPYDIYHGLLFDPGPNGEPPRGEQSIPDWKFWSHVKDYVRGMDGKFEWRHEKRGSVLTSPFGIFIHHLYDNVPKGHKFEIDDDVLSFMSGSNGEKLLDAKLIMTSPNVDFTGMSDKEIQDTVNLRIQAAEDEVLKIKSSPAKEETPITTNSAMNTPGGIDLNPAQMSMQVQKQGEDFKFDFNGVQMDASQVAGINFTILDIASVSNLPSKLGLAT
jgi:hypothetical protein